MDVAVPRDHGVTRLQHDGSARIDTDSVRWSRLAQGDGPCGVLMRCFVDASDDSDVDDDVDADHTAPAPLRAPTLCTWCRRDPCDLLLSDSESLLPCENREGIVFCARRHVLISIPPWKAKIHTPVNALRMVNA